MSAVTRGVPEVLMPCSIVISFNPEDQEATVKIVAQKMAQLYAKFLTPEGYATRNTNFSYDETPLSDFPIQEEVDLFTEELAKTIEKNLMPPRLDREENLPLEKEPKLYTIMLKTERRPVKILQDVLQYCGIWTMPNQPFYFPHRCINHIFLHTDTNTINIVIVSV